MPLSNIIAFMPSVLTLIGIPGLESVQCWIGIPFCATYIIAMIGNVLLLVVIKLERSLHEPMYIFLGVLGATDIALASCIMPKMLEIFWFHLQDIYFDSCLLQMCLIHGFQCVESGILLAMALDCYVAICCPLRHSTIFTHKLVTQVGALVIARAATFVSPGPVLIKYRFQFYYTTVIAHSYCEHMVIVKLAAGDISVNKIYGLLVAFSVTIFDLTFITLSYIQIFITIFRLPEKEARLKAFNTCIAHICVFLQFYILGFFFFTHRFGSHIPPYIHILFSSIYLLVPPFLNPLVYGVKTKQIRVYVVKMCCPQDPPSH